MSDNGYAGAVAVVTGASRGLGRSIALHFLAGGAHVLGLSRSTGTIDDPSYTHYICDVREDSQVRAAFRKIRRDFAPTILVNDAAVLDSQHSFMLTARSARDMLLTNVLGPFLVSRAAAKLMKDLGGGRIISIGSMAAVLEHPGDTIYAGTKAALATMTNVMAREFAAYGITCNTVGVTAVATDMLAQLPRHTADRIIAGLPLPRYATETDILNVIDFFASARSSYVTGQTIYLGGVHG